MTTCDVTIELTCEQALAAWPADVPLAALWSGDRHPASRWTVLGRPSQVTRLGKGQLDAVGRGLAVARDGAGWFVCLSYELGSELEPVAGGATGDWPLVTLLRCEDAWVHDGTSGVWSRVGSPPKLQAPQAGAPWHVEALKSGMGEAEYVRRAGRCVDYIRAGDVYQVNLSHPLEGTFSGSARSLFRDWVVRSGCWYGAYLEWDESGARRAVLSASPELFLSFDPVTRRLVTRPMKGTRPSGGVSGQGAEDLRDSPKERAELTMIVDLMRNDLGRVCEIGSVRVDDPRRIERHAGLGVLQATATVSGTLAAERTWWDVIRATFPGGSVTGAPKVRAMQIIRELEARPRGPYCGCIGFVSDSGAFQFNIAIRTALIKGVGTPGTLDGLRDGGVSYSVGAGIVADSNPHAEWRETIDKARVFLERAGGVTSPALRRSCASGAAHPA